MLYKSYIEHTKRFLKRKNYILQLFKKISLKLVANCIFLKLVANLLIACSLKDSRYFFNLHESIENPLYFNNDRKLL